MFSSGGRVASLVVLAVMVGPPAAVAQGTDKRPATTALGWDVLYDRPIRLAASLIMTHGRSTGVDTFSGAVVGVDLGLAGGRLRLGRTASGSGSGLELNAVGVRTWGNPWGTLPRQTHVGAEGRLLLLPFLVSGGFLVPVGGREGATPLLTVGLGFGLRER